MKKQARQIFFVGFVNRQNFNGSFCSNPFSSLSFFSEFICGRKNLIGPKVLLNKTPFASRSTRRRRLRDLVQFPWEINWPFEGVSRSGYYRWQQAEPSRREKENAQLIEQIREVFEANKSRYGSPRITKKLRRQGLKCGEKRIARLMQENNQAARSKRRFGPVGRLPLFQI